MRAEQEAVRAFSKEQGGLSKERCGCADHASAVQAAATLHLLHFSIHMSNASWKGKSEGGNMRFMVSSGHGVKSHPRGVK